MEAKKFYTLEEIEDKYIGEKILPNVMPTKKNLTLFDR